MRIENGTLDLDARDDIDANIRRVALRGVHVKNFDNEPLSESETAVVDKLFWAGRNAVFWAEDKQVGIDDTKCSLTPNEAERLVGLLEAGLKYADGIEAKNRFWHRDLRYVNSMASVNLAPNEAQFALPGIQAFAE